MNLPLHLLICQTVKFSSTSLTYPSVPNTQKDPEEMLPNTENANINLNLSIAVTLQPLHSNSFLLRMTTSLSQLKPWILQRWQKKVNTIDSTFDRLVGSITCVRKSPGRSYALQSSDIVTWPVSCSLSFISSANWSR